MISQHRLALSSAPPTFVFNHISEPSILNNKPNTYSLGMSYLAPSTSSLHSTETTRQGAIGGESQPQRYALFSGSAYYQSVLNKLGPWATVHKLRGSTSSTTIPLLTYFISIDRPCSMEKRMMRSVHLEGENGSANDGGTNSHKFAKDGETSLSDRHPTWAFASSLHGTRRCRHARPLTFPSTRYRLR